MNRTDKYIARKDFPLHRQRSIIDFEKGDGVVICGFKKSGKPPLVSFSVPIFGVICCMSQSEFGDYFEKDMVEINVGTCATVKEAMDSITDSGPDKRYVVKVESGALTDAIPNPQSPPIPKVKPVGKKKSRRKKR